MGVACITQKQKGIKQEKQTKTKPSNATLLIWTITTCRIPASSKACLALLILSSHYPPQPDASMSLDFHKPTTPGGNKFLSSVEREPCVYDLPGKVWKPPRHGANGM